MRNCPNCGSSKHTVVMTEGAFKIAKCGNCSLVYLLNVPDESAIYEDYYKIEFTKDDYKQSSKFPHLSEIYRINEQRLKVLKQIKPEGKLLDIGCGSGLFMATASKYGYHAYGVDVSKTALEFTNDEMGLKAGNETLDELNTRGDKYDIITLWHVLEHFLKPADELKKIHSLLNDRGICLIEVPNFESVKFRLSKDKWKGGNHPLYHRTFFTEKTLKDTLAKAGFTKNERLKLSYSLPSHGNVYHIAKKLFNAFAMDAFLNFAAYK